MDVEIKSFIQSFGEAIQASRQAQISAKRARAARRLAARLADVLSGEGDSDPVLLDLERRARGIQAKLDEVAERSVDLQPFVRKGEAILELEDLVPPDAVAAVRERLKESAEVAGETRSQRARLPFNIAVECVDCQETIVGSKRGTPRWGHARSAVTRHDEQFHEGLSPQERIDLRSAPAGLRGGDSEVTVKRYRIFRTSSA